MSNAASKSFHSKGLMNAVQFVIFCEFAINIWHQW